MNRRQLITGILSAAALAKITLAGARTTWPSKPIKLIVPYPAGGGTDFFARQVAPGMGEALGQPVIVENRPGASGLIGGQAVATLNQADGYTILLGDMTTYAVNPTLLKKQQQYDVQKDLAPLTLGAKFDFLLVVNPMVLPATSVQDIVAAAATAPGGLNYASPGIGTTHHLAMEMFARETHAKLVAVHYRGGAPAVQDLLGGRVGLMFLDYATARQYVESGRLDAIATAGDQRIAAYPDLPTLAELGVKNFSVEGWQGLTARAGTPEPVIRALAAAYAKSIANPETRGRLSEAGIKPAASSPAEFGSFIEAETARWRKVILEQNINAE